MTRCAMAVCTKTGSAVNYNRFPNLPKISNVWIQRCKWEEKWNPNLCRVCSNHFTADYFERDLNAKPLEMLLTRRLKCDALPSLNLTINNDNDHPPLDAIYSLRGRGPGTVQFHTNAESKGEDEYIYIYAKVVQDVGVVSSECKNLQTK